ncbi:hypothetical protein KJ780_03585, partial [Candidatus Micrarchaeota archaeon]|nr:hypothetical protein [Candidatus Micrarchaeota archaeon]
DARLYSESGGRIVVSVEEKNCRKFEKIMEGTIFAKIGRVRGDKRFVIRMENKVLINENTLELGEIWNKVRI